MKHNLCWAGPILCFFTWTWLWPLSSSSVCRLWQVLRWQWSESLKLIDLIGWGLHLFSHDRMSLKRGWIIWFENILTTNETKAPLITVSTTMKTPGKELWKTTCELRVSNLFASYLSPMWIFSLRPMDVGVVCDSRRVYCQGTVCPHGLTGQPVKVIDRKATPARSTPLS